jgi:short subunit dehydrogenase-like uncharacterized protein
MASIVLFGATGFTGRLTAKALARRGADFTIVGRDPEKLKALASEVEPTDIAVADATDLDALQTALRGADVLISCVGPFERYGKTALEAALRAGVHYVDSTGEGTFIDKMIDECDERARDTGIALAPALGFDETPGDLAVELASHGLDRPDVTVTYALPRTGSRGTVRSAFGILTTKGPFLRDGQVRWTRAGELQRWAPMPPPLGPRRCVSFPLALLRLAPRGRELSSVETYVTVGHIEHTGLRYAFPLLKLLVDKTPESVMERFLERLPEGPEGDQRNQRWTILAEARSGDSWRNVSIVGKDVYGITAETLTLAALNMAQPGFNLTGVISPVQAAGRDALIDALTQLSTVIETYEPTQEGAR